MGLGVFRRGLLFRWGKDFDMTSQNKDSQQPAAPDAASPDTTSTLWQKYEQRQKKSSRILATGLGAFALFVVFLLAVGLWIVAVR